MKRLSDLIVAAMLTAWFPMATAEAESCSWIGPAAGNWNNPDNWTPSQVPGSGDTAAIPAGSHWVVIDNAVAINGLSIGTGSSLTLAAQMDLYGPLHNAGTLNWQDGDIVMYNSAAQGSTGAITNAAGGVLDIGCDRVVVGSEGAPQLHNAGTLRKTATTGSTEIIVFFDSTGEVDVQSGTINCYVGGNLGGVLQAASAATIYLISGDYVLSNTPTFQGLGQVGMYGSLVLTGSYSGTFGIFGGSLALGSNLTVASDGILNIQGLVGLDGQLSNAGTIHIADSTERIDVHGTLINEGTLNWLGGDMGLFYDLAQGWSGQISNTATGVFDIRCDRALANSYGTPHFHNAGTLRKSMAGGNTNVSIILDNTGTVEARAGTLNFLGGVTQHTDTTLSGGTWNLSNDAQLNFALDSNNITLNQAHVTLDGADCGFARFTSDLAGNEGSLTLSNGCLLTTQGALTNTGTLRVEGPGTSLNVTGSYTQTAGSTTFVGSAGITATAMAQTGGTLAGTGTLHGSLASTAAAITPGLSAGTLSVSGSTTLGADNVLNMEVGGLTPGTQHDQLLVSANLTVGGALNVGFVDGFADGVTYNDTLTLADAGGAISGSFTNVASGGRLNTGDGQHSFAVYYGAGSPHGADKIVLAEFSDAIAPVINKPSNMTVEATGPAGTVAAFAVSSNDAVQGLLPAIATPPSGSLFPLSGGGPQLPLGETTVQVSAQDAGGNVANDSFTVTVVDTIAPVLSLPAPITAEATGPGGAVVGFAASASDIVDPAPQLVLSRTSGTLFAIGVTTIDATATDYSANPRHGSFTVTVQDTTKPSLTLPADITVEATGTNGATVSYSATASDLVDPSPVIVYNPPSGSTFAVGTSTVHVSATDAAANTRTGEFTVTVLDSIPPVLNIPPDMDVEATGPGGGLVAFSVSATDTVDGNISAVATPPSGSIFPFGTTTVNVSATDSAHNETHGHFTITVRDTTKPSLNMPGNLIVEATGAGGAVATYAVSATDVVDGAVPATVLPVSGSNFPIGTTPVNVSAIDAAGNRNDASFNVTVRDHTAPDMSLPAPIVVEAAGPGGTLVSFTASASDIVDPAPLLELSPASGSLFPIGINTVVATATDATGNKNISSFTVTVRDTIAPILTQPPDIIVAGTCAAGTVVNFSLSASDAVGATIITTPPSGYMFPLGGPHTVNVTARDAANNAVYASFTVTVVGLRTWSLVAAKPSTPAKLSGSIRGGPYGTAVLQASSDLGQTDAWEDITLIELDATGNKTFGPIPDPNSIGQRQGYFRVRLP